MKTYMESLYAVKTRRGWLASVAAVLATCLVMPDSLSAQAFPGLSEAIDQLAHKLKGTAANLCGKRVEAACQELMDGAANGNAGNLTLGPLEGELADFDEALSEFRDDLAQGAA